ncbi:MAG: hypothetical protein WC641_04045 [Patescibacteria group bacterium]
MNNIENLEGDKFFTKIATSSHNRYEPVAEDGDSSINDDYSGPGEFRRVYWWEAEVLIEEKTSGKTVRCLLVTQDLKAEFWTGDFWKDMFGPFESVLDSIAQSREFYDHFVGLIMKKHRGSTGFPTPKSKIKVQQTRAEFWEDYIFVSLDDLLARGILLDATGQRSLPLAP